MAFILHWDRTMHADALIKIVIQSDVTGPRDLLSHFILRQIDGLRIRSGIQQACSVVVDATHDFRGARYLINLEIGSGPVPALIQEVNSDPFLAVRDAFAIASKRTGLADRSWRGGCTP